MLNHMSFNLLSINWLHFISAASRQLAFNLSYCVSRIWVNAILIISAKNTALILAISCKSHSVVLGGRMVGSPWNSTCIRIGDCKWRILPRKGLFFWMPCRIWCALPRKGAFSWKLAAKSKCISDTFLWLLLEVGTKQAGRARPKGSLGLFWVVGPGFGRPRCRW